MEQNFAEAEFEKKGRFWPGPRTRSFLASEYEKCAKNSNSNFHCISFQCWTEIKIVCYMLCLYYMASVKFEIWTSHTQTHRHTHTQLLDLIACNWSHSHGKSLGRSRDNKHRVQCLLWAFSAVQSLPPRDPEGHVTVSHVTFPTSYI